MLTVKNLSFAYRKGKKKHPVFKDLSVSFGQGLNVILGPNGAGKSTLLKAIFGLLDYQGSISYASEDLSALALEDKTKLMSYLPQMDVEISTLTVLEMVILGRLPDLGHKITDEDLNMVMETLKSFNIDSLATRNFSELSGGQKKLVFIAQTLVRKPKLILLDEPVNSLDLQKQLELCQILQKIIKNQKVDIVVVIHDINLAVRYGQHIVVLDNQGGLYSAGKPEEVVTCQMLEEVYGVVADLSYDARGKPMISPVCSVGAV